LKPAPFSYKVTTGSLFQTIRPILSALQPAKLPAWRFLA